MNQKRIIISLGVIVIILIGTTVYFATINKVSAPVIPASKVVQQPAPTPTPVLQQSATQSGIGQQTESRPIAPASKTTQQRSVPKKDTDKVVGITNGGLIQKEYTSYDLGIRFKYIAGGKGWMACKITREGNKVFVCGDQSVEIFNKDPNKSLKQAVERQFLKNYSPEKCFFKEYSTDDGSEIGGISYPINKDSASGRWAGLKYCPPNYSETNGVMYFEIYPNRPDKYVFFNIGQVANPADDNETPWEDTFKFIN